MQRRRGGCSFPGDGMIGLEGEPKEFLRTILKGFRGWLMPWRGCPCRESVPESLSGVLSRHNGGLRRCKNRVLQLGSQPGRLLFGERRWGRILGVINREMVKGVIINGAEGCR